MMKSAEWSPGGIVPAKSLTLTSAPRLMSSFTCLASPRMAAMCSGVSPRSFLLLTLSFCRDEVLLGTFFWTGVVCEGWLGVESGHRQAERKVLNWCLKEIAVTDWDKLPKATKMKLDFFCWEFESAFFYVFQWGFIKLLISCWGRRSITSWIAEYKRWKKCLMACVVLFKVKIKKDNKTPSCRGNV